MRDILFRGFHECENGKQKAFYNCEWHTGDWVCGKSILFLKENGGEYYMPKCDEKCKTIHLENGDIEESNCADYNTAFYKVAPETVCQYTELTDKNGKKTFENDIVKSYYKLQHGESKYTDEQSIGVIEYDLKLAHFCCRVLKGKDVGIKHYFNRYSNFEIIGNKFENLELLEVEE